MFAMKNPMKLSIPFLSSFSIFFLSIALHPFTPGKWNYKDSLILFPNPKAPKPIREKVYNEKNQLVLTSELVYEGHFLVKEIFKNPNNEIDGFVEYIYDKEGRITKEVTKNPKGEIIDSKEYTYKGSQLSKVRFFTSNGELYMDSTVFQWMDGMIASGEILWMETKDREKILVTGSGNQRTMTILDEKKQPLATVDFFYDEKGFLKERLFQQNETLRKNAFTYDKEGRLIGFSFHVKQDGKWVLEKSHQLEYP